MELWADRTPIFLRRATAAVIVAVLALASFGLTAPTRGFAGQAVFELVNPRVKAAKPCQKALLPGEINTCQVSGGVNSLAGSAPNQNGPDPAVRTLSWHMSSFRLPAQCSGPSPYRPPCLSL